MSLIIARIFIAANPADSIPVRQTSINSGRPREDLEFFHDHEAIHSFAAGSCARHRTREHCALSVMLTVSQLSKSFAGRALFDDVSLQVNRGDRIGLVGPNGAGKSTLFALLLGNVSPDKGTIAIEKNATIGFLPQETAAAGDETVLELALAVSPELVHAQKVIKQHESGNDHEHEHENEHEHEHVADDVAYHNALHVFDEHGGWELEPKAKRVLAGLAFRETDFDRP